MIELIETLNHTSPLRTLLYCATAIIIVAIFSDTVTSILKQMIKIFKW